MYARDIDERCAREVCTRDVRGRCAREVLNERCAREMVHERWCTRGGAREVVHERCAREVCTRGVRDRCSREMLSRDAWLSCSRVNCESIVIGQILDFLSSPFGPIGIELIFPVAI